MKKMIKFYMCLGLFMLAFSGCSSSRDGIMVTNYPVAYLVERLSGGTIEPIMIGDSNYIQRSNLDEQSIKEMKKIKALFYDGGLEPYMDVNYEKIKETGINIVNIGTMNSVYNFNRYTKNERTKEYEEVPYYDSPVFDGIDMYQKDPFIWLDPVMMTSLSETVTSHLIKLYPDKENIFLENQKKLELELAQLGANYQAALKDKEIRFAAMSPTFGNWQKSYGIEFYPIVLSKYGVLPNEDQLSEIESSLIEHGITYLVIDPYAPDDVLALQNQLIQDLGLQPIELKGLTVLSKEDTDRKKDYLSLMYENLNLLISISEN